MVGKSKNESLDDLFKKLLENSKNYLNSLNNLEVIALSLIGAGLLFLILGIVFT